MIMAPAFFEIMILMFGMGLSAGGSILGLPPGERDVLLVQCPGKDVVFYTEWAERGAGKQGAPGIDGLAADPEVLTFLKETETALVNSLKDKTSRGPKEAQVFGTTFPALAKTMLNRSGCLYVEVDAEAIANAAKQGGGPGPFGWIMPVASGIKATLIVNGGAESDRLAKTLNEILALLPQPPAEDLQKVKFPLPPGFSLTLHRQEKHFILGFGEGTVEQALAGLSGQSQGLKSNTRFTSGMQHVTIGKMSGVSWLDLKAVREKLTKALGPDGALVEKTARDAGLDKLDSVVSYRGVENGQIRTRSFVKTGGSLDGLLALAAGRGIRPDDFSTVPADADFAFSISLDMPKILAASKDIVSKAHPPSQVVFEQILQQLETELGLSIEEDFFKAFGDVWTVYNSKSAGGLFVSNLVGALEVRDTAKAEKVFSKAMDLLRDTLPGETSSGFRRRGVFLVNNKFMGNKIYFVNTIGDEVPFAPAFCLTGKQLLIGPHPQAIKAHLRFLADDKKETFVSRVKEMTSGTEGELLCVSHFDTKSLVRYLYAVTPYFGQIFFSEIQREGIGMTVFSLPSARAILPYVGNSVSTVVRTEEGILFDGRTALPIPVFSLVAANMPMWLFMWRMQRFGALENPEDIKQAEIRENQKKLHKKSALKTPASGGQSPNGPATRSREKQAPKTTAT